MEKKALCEKKFKIVSFKSSITQQKTARSSSKLFQIKLFSNYDENFALHTYLELALAVSSLS